MRIKVKTGERQSSLGDLYGIFFEDLNHAADGGLYGELVCNRSFEFDEIDNPSYHHLTGWERIGSEYAVKLCVETGNPVSGRNPHYLSMDIQQPGSFVGVKNSGFHGGICLEEGGKYLFSCYAKREQDLDRPLRISLCSEEGKVLAEGSAMLTREWKKYAFTFQAEEKTNRGFLALTGEGRGKIYLDFVSLFPADTFRGRENGMRRDLAELLEELHPKFMRFPGGCLTHDGALDPEARDAQYRWKNTVGPLEERPARRNNWCYNQTLGLGFYEYFLFCEDIGTKPLPVLSPGYDPHHHREAPLGEMQYFIDEALDLIEFANGGADTEWGGLRAAMGHPEPFGMEYLGIGNEEVGEAFFDRFRAVCRAVQERYPEMKIVGTAGPYAGGSEYERGWRHAREDGIALVDEHYYMTPEWFLTNHHRYDSFRSEDPHVFLGEYASKGNTWWNALCEASYMIGLERNAHAVDLACYAPLLCASDYVNWKPDLIWFDGSRSFGTANYYVQKLFMRNQGKDTLAMEFEEQVGTRVWADEKDSITGEILLHTDCEETEYREIRLKNCKTGEEKQFAPVILQGGKECFSLGTVDWAEYTITAKAKRRKGERGFLVTFGEKENGNRFTWIVGGWQNQDVMLEEWIGGHGSCLDQYLMSVEPEREYELRLHIAGRRIRAWIDGRLVQDVTADPLCAEELYCSAAMDGAGNIILKVVNVLPEEQEAAFLLEGIGKGAHPVEIYEMSHFEREWENSFEEPLRVSPVEKRQEIQGDSFSYCFPKESLTILKIQG